MKILIDGKPLVIERQYIEEHVHIIKESLLAKYGHIDTLVRTPLRVLSQTLLNKLFEATQNPIWKLPSKKDVSIHLIESIFTFIISELENIDINIHVTDGKVTGVCIEKESENGT